MIEAIVTGLACGLVTWGGLRVEMRYLRRDVDRAQEDATRAHHRLDRIGAPPVWGVQGD